MMLYRRHKSIGGNMDYLECSCYGHKFGGINSQLDNSNINIATKE